MDTYEQFKKDSDCWLSKRNKALHRAELVRAAFILAILIGAWSFVLAVVL